MELPKHLIDYIYQFDNTYKEKYDLVIRQINIINLNIKTKLSFEVIRILENDIYNMDTIEYLDHFELSPIKYNNIILSKEELNYKIPKLKKEFTLVCPWYGHIVKNEFNENGFTIKEFFNILLEYEIELRKELFDETGILQYKNKLNFIDCLKEDANLYFIDWIE